MRGHSSIKCAAVITLALSLSGCGTIINFIPKNAEHQDEYCRIYGGVRTEIRVIGSEQKGLYAGYANIVKVLMVIDFPLSLAMDTATLPFVLVAMAFGAGGGDDVFPEKPPPPSKSVPEDPK